MGGNGVTALTGGNYLVASLDVANSTGQVMVGLSGNIGFDTASGQTLRMNPTGLAATLAGGTAVTLQASNDITVNSNITVAGTAGGALTLQAGRNINLNSVITTANGNFTASAGDPAAFGPGREPGDAAINQAPGSAINAGTGVVTLLVNGKQTNGPTIAVDSPQLNGAFESVFQTSRQLPNGNIRANSFDSNARNTVVNLVGCGIGLPSGADTSDCN